MGVGTEPAGYVWAVTPSDDVDLTIECRGLWIGTGGDITINAVDPRHPGTVKSVTLTNVPDGSLLPVRATRVLDTGTDATGIVALA